MVRNLKWLGAAFEAFLGIPAIGGLFIISMGYTPLGFMLVFHIVLLVVSLSRLKRISVGAIIGITASVLGFIPFLGMMLHWVAAIALAIDALLTPREQVHMTKEDDRF
ncbi:hypothetical protein [Exiguobacterium chiriqhucha]|uniref:hypothetical protein n=1 Tax=Exiguobacterium chiriqhucha TaxID=1385984 RepID=UPI000736552E|nr:hypothetical protein [Exiguobacterium chiriqhucha]